MKPSLFFFICIVTFASCKKNNTSPTVTHSNPVDVYIVGNDNTNPVYWKNGIEVPLSKNIPSGNLAWGEANDITIYGNDIYIVGGGGKGNGGGMALYWKNGIVDTLPSVTSYVFGYVPVITSANSIVVTPSNIYVGGYQSSTYVGIQNGSILWTNGTPSAFDEPTAYVSSLFYSNGNLYTAGYSGNGNGYFAGYYKNGAFVNLSNNLSSSTNDIFISGENLYAAGKIYLSDTARAVYWKNGILNILSSIGSQANSIFVNDNDVYAAGDETINGNQVATIWKNGTAIHLMPITAKSTCSQVVVSGTDVYAIGWVYDIHQNSTATMWKNGIATTLAPATSYANTIYIKPIH